MKVIEIIILSTGESRLETRGFQGSECREASRALEAALGKKITDIVTAEFHESEVVQPSHLEQKE
ncbi:DUF2997 domain-containing protein [Bremerella cremea]|uniref:DUF2997 domain-containing protein n=1 Tax=Blastopirellula marina TaxID=124 RepID=A0A2S8FCF4_9BACT|nr:hypothetical protein C5Y83_27680 [Blastopirellula marina]RCS43129.1 DUF2997 domain-containing protein [Bremerella cremea]